MSERPRPREKQKNLQISNTQKSILTVWVFHMNQKSILCPACFCSNSNLLAWRTGRTDPLTSTKIHDCKQTSPGLRPRPKQNIDYIYYPITFPGEAWTFDYCIASKKKPEITRLCGSTFFHGCVKTKSGFFTLTMLLLTGEGGSNYLCAVYNIEHSPEYGNIRLYKTEWSDDTYIFVGQIIRVINWQWQIFPLSCRGEVVSFEMLLYISGADHRHSIVLLYEENVNNAYFLFTTYLCIQQNHSQFAMIFPIKFFPNNPKRFWDAENI